MPGEFCHCYQCQNCINPCENGWLLDPAWRNQSRNGSGEEPFVLSHPSVPSALPKPPWQRSQVEIHPPAEAARGQRATDTSPQNLCQALEPSQRPTWCCQHWDRVIRHPEIKQQLFVERFSPLAGLLPVSHPWFLCIDVLPSLLHCCSVVCGRFFSFGWTFPRFSPPVSVH